MPPRRKLSDLDRGRAICNRMATRRCCCQACSGSLCHHQTKTEMPRNWKSAGATTFWSAQSHHTKRGSLHSEAGHATKNCYGKQH
ncbi:hypothetical protein V1264_014010 [Littorina saxatilis]|uniref:Uncharacterized protein n=1 Tax=Littorina saxatilis TaxID=31220 RepID=A0AAN9BQW5_9CAEN